jgi:branched-chain amino acid transport system ATP-binding protein
MLKVQSISTYYGNLCVLHGVSLHVKEGEAVALIGANGAGKTTLMKSICGLLPTRTGHITFSDKDITGAGATKIVRRGIAMSPEGRKLFATLTVMDNLVLGAYHRYGNDRAEIEADMKRVFEIFPRLAERRTQLAGTLSGGEQQMLAVGRALMSRPKLLLLDEPSMGLAPTLIEEIFAVLRTLREEGLTLLIVEQNVRLAFSMASRAYVLETGHITMQGAVSDLMANKEVKRAYLGKGYKEVWE